MSGLGESRLGTPMGSSDQLGLEGLLVPAELRRVA